jgi:hypothetical protein
MVKIKMDLFVKKYQPERYDLWRLGLEDSYPLNSINQSDLINENNKRTCSYQDFNLRKKSFDLFNHKQIEVYLHNVFDKYLQNKNLDNSENFDLYSCLNDMLKVTIVKSEFKSLKELSSIIVNSLIKNNNSELLLKEISINPQISNKIIKDIECENGKFR